MANPEPAPKRPNMTPRNSKAINEDPEPKATPYHDLHALADAMKDPIPATPETRRRNSFKIGTASASRIFVRTPGTAAARTPIARPHTVATNRFAGSARRTVPTTPYAVQALQLGKQPHRATPLRDRRKSGRQARETPRDALRELSRLLAGNSRRISASPQVQPASVGRRKSRAWDDVDEGPEVAPPRLSLAIEDEDSFHEKPPRLSELPDSPEEDKENYTIQSVEAARDKRSSQVFDRESFGTTRASEIFGQLGDIEQSDREDLDQESHRGTPTNGVADDVTDIDDFTKHTFADGDNTREFRGLIDARRRQSAASDLGTESSPGAIQDETFQFRLDTVRRQSGAEKPNVESSPARADEDTFQFRFADRSRRETLAPTVFSDPSPELDEHPQTEDHNDPAPFVLDNIDDEDLDDDAIDAMVDETMAFLNASPSTQQLQLRQESGAIDARPAATAVDPASPPQRKRKRADRSIKFSRHGTPYPSLPLPVIKKLATAFARSSGALGPTSSLSKDALLELEVASELFFEQVSGDLAAYAEHGGRTQIRDDDVAAVMRRQRVLDDKNTTFSLGQKYLGRELCQELRVKPPKVRKSRKRKALQSVPEELDEG